MARILRSFAMDLSAYLRRIDYDGPLRVDFETLRGVQRAHARAIPYENFDVQLRRPLTTDPQAAFDKIVGQRRGGWCYEQNGLLGLALAAIGFAVTRLAGNGASPASHLVLRVDLMGEAFVCDVGFADGPFEPYRLVEGPFDQNGFPFVVEFLPDGGFRLVNHPFGMTPGFTARGPDESAMAETCRWLQTDPTSPFVQNTVACARGGDGVILSMVGRVLREIRPGGVEKTLIATAGDYVATLKDRFRLDFPQAAELWPQICRRHEDYERRRAARLAAEGG